MTIIYQEGGVKGSIPSGDANRKGQSNALNIGIEIGVNICATRTFFSPFLNITRGQVDVIDRFANTGCRLMQGRMLFRRDIPFVNFFGSTAA